MDRKSGAREQRLRIGETERAEVLRQRPSESSPERSIRPREQRARSDGRHDHEASAGSEHALGFGQDRDRISRRDNIDDVCAEDEIEAISGELERARVAELDPEVRRQFRRASSREHQLRRVDADDFRGMRSVSRELA